MWSATSEPPLALVSLHGPSLHHTALQDIQVIVGLCPQQAVQRPLFCWPDIKSWIRWPSGCYVGLYQPPESLVCQTFTGLLAVLNQLIAYSADCHVILNVPWILSKCGAFYTVWYY